MQKVGGLEAQVLLVIAINIIFNITQNQYYGMNTLLYIKIWVNLTPILFYFILFFFILKDLLEYSSFTVLSAFSFEFFLLFNFILFLNFT